MAAISHMTKERFPLLLDAEEAAEYLLDNPRTTDAIKAYAVGIMSKDGMSNAEIRDRLNIEKVYEVTHLKRAGTNLTEEELELWHNNPKAITLGHVRAIAKMSFNKREPLLRDLLSKRKPVHEYEKLARGEAQEKDSDIARYETDMEERLGRGVKINYNRAKKSGKITLDFYGLDDLDTIAEKLGFTFEA